MSVQILEREFGLRLNVAAAVRDVLQQRVPVEQALQRLLHDTTRSAVAPAARMPRPRSLKPGIGRGSETTRPVTQPWGLSYA